MNNILLETCGGIRGVVSVVENVPSSVLFFSDRIYRVFRISSRQYAVLHSIGTLKREQHTAPYGEFLASITDERILAGLFTGKSLDFENVNSLSRDAAVP